MFHVFPPDILLLILEYLPSKYYYGSYYVVLIQLDIRYERLLPKFKDRLFEILTRKWSCNINHCLKEAAKINDYIELFIERGANDWNAALEGASYSGDMKWIQYFIEKSNKLLEGLYSACRSGNYSTIQWYLNQDFITKNKDFDWNSVFCFIGKSGNLETIKHFRKTGLKDIHLLYGAIESGNIELLTTLLYIENWDTSITNRCLGYAVLSGKYELIGLYLQKADKFYHALGSAIIVKNMKFISLFYKLEKIKSLDTLNFFTQEAGKTGDIKVIEFFIDKGGAFYQALYEVIRNGFYDTSCYMLEKYKEEICNTLTSSHYSDNIERIVDNALVAAIETGNLKMVKLVERYGGKCRNCLEMAVNYKFRHILDYFIEKGYDNINNLNEALLGSVYSEYMPLSKYVISKGANAINSAMIVAVAMNRMDFVEYFIELGANDWNAGLKKATRNRKIDIMKFFISKGACNLTDVFKRAIKNNVTEVIEFFINEHKFPKQCIEHFKKEETYKLQSYKIN